MQTYIALFKGINVGGNKKVKMEELKKIFILAGLKNPRTYIQSGNVVFNSSEKDVKKLSKKIETEFERKFSFTSTVILRSEKELTKIASDCPIPDYEKKEFKWIMVNFFLEAPGPSAKKDLLESYNGPEEIFLKEKEMFIYYPDGSGRSKLNGALIEKKLNVITTSRNWNTILKLLELSEAEH